MARQASHAGFSRTPLQQLAGFVLCIAAFYLALCLFTYDPRDPSFNRAAATHVSNVGGTFGAILADLCQQFLGLASLTLVVVPIAWGSKLILGRPISWLWLRFTMLILGMTLLATLLSGIDVPLVLERLFTRGFGGAIGLLVHDRLYDMFKSWFFTGVVFVIMAVVMAVAFGMSVAEWRAMGRFFRKITMIAGVMAVTLKRWIFRPEPEEKEEVPETGWLERMAARFPLFSREKSESAAGGAIPESQRRKSPPRISRKSTDKSAEKEKSTAKAQSSFALSHGDYVLPPIPLLATPPKSRKGKLDESALTQNARLLESVLRDFGVNGEIIEIRPGPVVTLYELEPAAGTKSSRVVGLADDIARSMSAVSARIAVIPGRNAIGIELPNATREMVFLRELLESEPFETSDSRLPLALGKDIGGTPIIVDLARMPHLLVAGTTGSGKSVAINTMIMSLVYRRTPEECKFIMIDPKMLELSVYEGIPHLLSPVVTEPGKAVVALKWTVKEMENRYRQMSNLGVRNIDGYNKKIREAKAKGKQLTRTVQTGFDPETGSPIFEETPLEMVELPYIVVVVDEMADLMIVAGKDIETSVQRLAQMARAAGIHIIMATQRPSVDVITGVIKANFPTRISFQVTSRIDSRTILGEQGAEQLLGQGDMLYMAGGGRITRIHGPFVTDKEVEMVVEHLKAQGTPSYVEDITREEEEEGDLPGMDGEKDELYDQAVAIVLRDRKASTSYIQRCLKVGYNRAATIIERMEREGLVGPANHVGKREVLARSVDA